MPQQSAEDGQAEDLFIVFEGSSAEDGSHARQLWKSIVLLPPRESRLASADIRHRLPVARPKRRKTKDAVDPVQLTVWSERQREEERRRYQAMADQKKEVVSLLERQRQQRIQKELVSAAVKPKKKMAEPADPEIELDKELVRQLP
ncbi:cilia- and flagella-associated protein HOATZ [Poeciliopsis prolifica]|uniref:cilia- and flagella-associated protein HOATZ n=1 Tax=Poeciliopsis prolifica TaxID=188132 RepID=UPI002412EB34|nr:cilia- and flagella-associated protein HOATZ [Poeciliopsis prolifica]